MGNKTHIHEQFYHNQIICLTTYLYKYAINYLNLISMQHIKDGLYYSAILVKPATVFVGTFRTIVVYTP